MNCFMGYNPLASKQVKITVWVCEQDGASPVAPSNPSEGDCFIVYATDEAMLSNTPTSKKTYTNGDWADAEGGGGGDSDIKSANVTISLADYMATTDVFHSSADIVAEEMYMTPSFFVYDYNDYHTGWSFFEVTTTPKTVKFCWVVTDSPEYPSNVARFEGAVYNDVMIIGDAEYNDGIFTINGDCIIVVGKKVH